MLLLARAAENSGMARILVIDDEAVLTHVIRVTLESRGHEVMTADDGSRGFASAQRQAPDAIVLDLMMPVMDGFAVLDALQNDPRTASVPVLVLSAITTNHTEQQCYRLGAKAYMSKPFASDHLVGVLEDVIAAA
jgi:twitching motility two-component system response regulator PilH